MSNFKIKNITQKISLMLIIASMFSFLFLLAPNVSSAANCGVVSAEFTPDDTQAATWYTDANKPDVKVDIVTSDCEGRTIEVSITESDALGGDDDLPNSGLDNLPILVPTSNHIIMNLKAGEEACEAGLGDDCYYYISVYGLDTSDYESNHEPKGNLIYECDTICLDDWVVGTIERPDAPVTLSPDGTKDGDWHFYYKDTTTGKQGTLSPGYADYTACEAWRTSEPNKGKVFSDKCFEFYVPLAPLPGFSDPVDTSSSDCPFGRYLNILIKLFIGICAVLAMIKIVIGGLQYMTSELVSSKEEGKKSILNAVFGLILALGAIAILNTLNPELRQICFKNVKEVTVQVLPENEPETGITPDSTGKATISLIKKSDGSAVALSNCDTSEMVQVNAFGTSIQVYKGLKPSIERINQKWLAHAANDRYPVKVIYGYNCRKVKNKNAWSAHAFGLALDINPQENPYSSAKKTDMPAWFRQLFIDEGWGWGGNWTSIKDTMHFSKYPASEGGDKKIEI